MTIRRWLATLAVSVAAAAAFGQGEFAQRTVTIRAGVAIADANKSGGLTVGANSTPYVFFNIDRSLLSKPAGWVFVNPHAATNATANVVARWTAIATWQGVGAPPADVRLDKNAAAYWEVLLNSVSDAQLADYDVLLLSVYHNFSLNPLEREKLRKFVDQGGVLLLDVTSDVTTQIDPTNVGPLPFAVSAAAAGNPRTSDGFSPLLTHPNAIDQQALRQIETSAGALISPELGPYAPQWGNLEKFFYNIRADYAKLVPVVSDAAGVTLALGKIGDGFVVVTARGMAKAINRVLQSGGYVDNDRFYALAPTFDRAADAATKLIVNAIHLGAGFNQSNGGSRKARGFAADFSAPLLRRFLATNARDPGIEGSHYPPVLFKGLLVVTTEDTVKVYDANPKLDLDGDGDPDDGEKDFSRGKGVDLIWTSAPMSGPISAPTCVEVQSPALNVPTDQILVVDVQGNAYGFDAFNLDVNGYIQGGLAVGSKYGPLAPPGGVELMNTANPTPGPYAPTVHEGLAYVVDSQNPGTGSMNGRVWVFNPAAGLHVSSGGQWFVGGTAEPGIPEIGASPTVGYIPIPDAAGGLDKVMYVATRPNPAIAASTSTAGIVSLWLGARGEKPRVVVAGTTMQLFTRASGRGLPIYMAGGIDPLAVKVTLIKANGDAYTPAEMEAVIDSSFPIGESNGVLTLQLDGAFDTNTESVRVDYTIDWGTPLPGVKGQINRGNLHFGDDSNLRRRVLHNLALSPEGNIFAVVSTGDYESPAVDGKHGGSIYTLREEGQGSFRMLYRYDVFDQFVMSLSQGASQDYRYTFVDQDGLAGSIAALQAPISRLTLTGGPTVRAGVVYVPATGVKTTLGGTDIPVTVVLALKANPEAVEIRTPDIGANFTVSQPDVTNSENKAIPTRSNILLQSQVSYEREPGATTGLMRLNSLMGNTRGVIQNSLNTSQPIVIRRIGLADLVIDPDSTGGRWSPLLWYTTFNGYANRSPLIATGNTLYMVGTSVLDDVVNDLTPPYTPEAVVVAMDGDFGPTDPMVAPDPDRPWQRQVLWVQTSPFKPNPGIRWPHAADSLGLGDWLSRIAQSRLGNATDVYGAAAGESGVYAFNDANVFGYGKADFLISDEGRVARYDPGGNPLWTSDASISTGSSGDTGTVGTTRPLVRPTRCYQLNDREMLIVDTGGNRVLRMDTTGRELRSIERFKLDPSYRPSGYRTNEPLTLNSPRDVVMFTTRQTSPANVDSPQANEYWIHYLIADGGNRRLIELIDRYSYNPATRQIGGAIVGSNGENQIGVLYTHSPSEFSGKRFEYNSVTRTFYDDGTTARFVVAAGIGGVLPTRAETGLETPVPGSARESAVGEGGVVIFDGNAWSVIGEVNVPAIGANVFWNDTTSTFNSAARLARVKRLGNLNSVAMRVVENPTGTPVAKLSIMVTDSTGIYELSQDFADAAPVKPWKVDWMLPREVYRAMRGVNAPYTTVGTPGLPNGPGTPASDNPRDLRPAYARRLDSGEVLIVNSYYGRTRGGIEFSGEIVQVSGDIDLTGVANNELPGFHFGKTNFGFGATSLRYKLPPIAGARRLLVPVFADRR